MARCQNALGNYARLVSGQHRTEAHGFPNVAYCEVAAKRQCEQQSLSSKTQFYCVKHEGVGVARRRPRPVGNV